eukprot:CAMPEP_0172430394 /NCGR_PEP_ID=MMETSP1064-20121228/54268_1 /TAXON_ID=202472 /ORGANISM="Aulacoseira subarctica , Strain CCAP 1002/5" /LENGTH=66 /DNA_ID=CAMNT_0013176407 /DNA_START=16 /DNA_END=212 /DNA_ORIENTATION=+
MPLKSNDQLKQQKHYVEHNYQDHSQDIPFHLLFFNDKTDSSKDQCTDTTMISEDTKKFPMKLQELL